MPTIRDIVSGIIAGTAAIISMCCLYLNKLARGRAATVDPDYMEDRIQRQRIAEAAAWSRSLGLQPGSIEPALVRPEKGYRKGMGGWDTVRSEGYRSSGSALSFPSGVSSGSQYLATYWRA